MNISNLKLLNNKQAKTILKYIKEQWDAEISVEDYAVLINDKNKIFIANREVFDIELDKLRINSLGLYIGETAKGIRLSIEGSQFIGPKAKKNIIEIDEEQVNNWIKGKDLEDIKGDYSGFLIVKHKNDFLGTGKFKENKILNFVPKIRRLP
ncbi:hypothetical protein KY328_00895 [Candidatus Woesearchaeota archaeon]|nr:hypothetical protein [Candidatus Woesearchaeota archaeon]